MAEPVTVRAYDWDTPEPPDVSGLTTEDDQPVENAFQDKQCDILTEALRVSWPQGRPFISGSDVAVFPAAKDEAAIVPDVLLSLGVEPPGPSNAKEFRSYFVWNFGKPPDLVFEIVSNETGGEDSTKLERYARIRVPYYIIYDPQQILSSRPLRIFQLTGFSYVEKVDRQFPEIGLGLTVWFGEFDGFCEHWLRWVDADGNLLAIGEEEHRRAEQERQRAEHERERAEHERERAEQERERAEQARKSAEQERERAEQERQRAEQAELELERLRQKLRELGHDEG